jgi:uncharacterized protein YbjT (DUF2867 family)
MLGNALDAASVQPALEETTTLVHLTGTAKPAPWKGKQFRAVDQVSLEASLEAARRAGIAHMVYVSVAHPAPVMRAYIAVRRECERAIRASGIRATVLRPWYVLGEGHRWPVVLLPLYKAAELVPVARQGALRLGLLRHSEMIHGLVWAVENPPEEPGTARTLTVPGIRALARESDAYYSGAGFDGKEMRKVTHVSAGR